MLAKIFVVVGNEYAFLEPMTDLSTTFDISTIYGRTVPELLAMGCEQNPNSQVFNRWLDRRWLPLSSAELHNKTEDLALGLLDLPLQKGDRLALLMHSDVPFALVDLASLTAGLVNVPIDLTQTIENILYCLNHSEAKALVISDLKLLYQMLPYLGQAKFLRWVIVAETTAEWEQKRQELLGNTKDSEISEIPPNACLYIPAFLCGEAIDCSEISDLAIPHCINLLSLEEVSNRGITQRSSASIQALHQQLAPQDLATIIYIASETHYPKGVMLSHENITSNALSAFASYPNLQTGAAEVVLLFLPLTHIFARVFLYGHLAYGHTIYFSNPNRLIRHLRMVNPTILITVPRLLEKIYERIVAKGDLFEIKGLRSRVQAMAFGQAMRLAHGYNVAAPPTGLANLPWQLSQRWVFSQWQETFGTRLHSLICGGAALSPELVNFFNGSGIPVIQGYGLTETSGVVCYNRKGKHRADTVGYPIPATQIRIAHDDEILIKAPFVMQGYYKDPAGTAKVIDQEGWFHTGDLGRLTVEGFLHITGIKKSQFKLSTGKYVSLKPLENALMASELVQWAIAVGLNEKFCGMLIFPARMALKNLLESRGVAYDLDNPRIQALYQNLVDQANCRLPYWSNIRKFALINDEIPAAFISPTGEFQRDKLYLRYALVIRQMYAHAAHPPDRSAEIHTAEDLFAPATCPTFARSLMHL